MVIKLGLTGSLQDVPQESMIFSAIGIRDPNKKSRSVDNTLHVDYRPEKKIFRLSYKVITEANFKTLVAIEDLQATNLAALEFQIDDQLGALTTYSVYMNPLSHGAIIRDTTPRYYYNVIVELEER